jgi:hypothetical protein
MPVTGVTPFDCPNCGAQYKLVRVETNETLLKPATYVPQSAVVRCEGARGGSFSNTSWWIVQVEGDGVGGDSRHERSASTSA